jgi:hypothetical protein
MFRARRINRRKKEKSINRAVYPDTAKKPEHTLDAVPEGLRDPNHALTEEDVLYLQRTIGNNATAQLIQAKSAEQSKTIQRAETGMRSSSAITRYSQAAFKIMEDNPNMAPNTFVREIHKLAGGEFSGLGAPLPNLVFVGGGGGAFDSTAWTIEVDVASVFGAATSVSTADQAKVDDLINTMYHESRHAEQNFRVARMRAGKILGGSTEQTNINQAVQQIMTATNMPENVVRAAANRPLYESWTSKFMGESDKMMDEAEAWDKTLFGVDANYSWMMQSGFDDVTKPLMDSAAAMIGMRNAVTTRKTLPKAQRKQVWQDYRAAITEFRSNMTDLDDFMTSEAQPELDRLNAIDVGDRTATDNTMIRHLEAIAAHYVNIQNYYADFQSAKSNSDIDDRLDHAVDVHTETDSLDDEVRAAYKDLPEESDAFATGDAAEAKVGQQRNAVGNP